MTYFYTAEQLPKELAETPAAECGGKLNIKNHSI